MMEMIQFYIEVVLLMLVAGGAVGIFIKIIVAGVFNDVNDVFLMIVSVMWTVFAGIVLYYYAAWRVPVIRELFAAL